jgi:hypothetical protein
MHHRLYLEPVARLKIHHTATKQTARKRSVTAKLTATLTSEIP